MVDLEQKVMIKWMNRNRKRFTSLGYEYTKLNEEFEVALKDIETNSNVKVVVQCDRCGKEIITPYRNYIRIINKSGEYRCRKCNAPYTSQIRINNNKTDKINKFKQLVESINYTTNVTEKDYKGYDYPLPIFCNIHGEQKISLKQLHQGCVCPECGKQNRIDFHKLTKDEIINIVESKNGDKILNPDDYVNIYTKNLRIICVSCNQEFLSSLSNIQNSSGHCTKCGQKVLGTLLRKDKETLIKQATVNGKCRLLNPDDYTDSFKRNLVFECYSCGKTFIRSFQHFIDGSKDVKNVLVKLV